MVCVCLVCGIVLYVDLLFVCLLLFVLSCIVVRIYSLAVCLLLVLLAYIKTQAWL